MNIKTINAVNRYFGLHGKDKLKSAELKKMDSGMVAQAAAMALPRGMVEYNEIK